MPQNATTAAPRFIPATGLTAEIDGLTVSAFWVNGAGWKVQARKDGLTVASNLHRHEHDAVAEFNTLVAKAEAEQPTEAPAPVRLPSAAKGTTTKVSDPGHTALAVAALTGCVERGRKPGQADVRLLTSLAKRGLLRLTHQEGRTDAREVVTGGELTGLGQRTLDRLTTAEREDAEKAARLAVIDTIRIAA